MAGSLQLKLEIVACRGSEEDMRNLFYSDKGEPQVNVNDDWRHLDLNSMIHHAIHFNSNIGVAKALLAYPEIDVNYSGQRTQTPLHVASHLASRDDRGIKLVELLLQRSDIDVNATAKFVITPLHVAARFSCLKVLELLLADERVMIDAKTEHGFTALHLVAQGISRNSNARIVGPLDQGRCEAVGMLTRAAAKRKQTTPNVDCCLNQADVLERFPLHYAVQGDSVEVVKALVSWSDTEINAQDIYGLTPLHCAARSKANRRAGVVKLLLQVPSIDVNMESSNVQQQLQMPQKNHIDWLYQFLPSQPVAAPQEGEQRALDIAAEEGHAEVVEMLLERNPESSNTLLHLASKNGWVNVLKELLNHATELELTGKNSSKDTILHLAAENGHVEILSLLLEHFAKHMHAGRMLPHLINEKNSDENTPLHLATKKGRVKVVDVLLERATELGVTINEKNSKKNTPLHLVAKNGHINVVETFLRRATKVGFTINEENLNKNTPLHLAAMEGHDQVVKVWLQVAPVFFLYDVNGDRNTPLHLAAKEGHDQVVKVWLNGGPASYLAAENKHGNTPLHLATKEGQFKVVNVILEHAINRNLIRKKWAVPAASQKRVAPKFNVNATNKIGNMPLHLAAKEGYAEVVKVFLKHATTLDLRMNGMNKHGNTPLHLAAKEGHVEVVEAFLKHATTLDLRMNGMNKDGNTPLPPAAMEFVGGAKVEALLKHDRSKLDINAKNVKTGDTPLHLASKEGHVDIVKVLVDHIGSKLDINAKNSNGSTPLHFATRNCHRNVVEALCEMKERLRANIEDVTLKTCLHYTKEQDNPEHREIANILMERHDVKDYLDGKYRDRQVFIDAANALLVGGALIAGITFVGWLQPPVGLTTYYQFPQSSPGTPPNTFELFAAVELHYSLRLFWVFNTLSFFFAIASVMSAAKAASPNLDTVFIVEAIGSVRRELLWTSILLFLAVLTVLGSFVCAGFAVLPPIHRDTNIMTISAVMGLIVCSLTLFRFFTTLFRLGKGAQSAQAAKLAQQATGGNLWVCLKSVFMSVQQVGAEMSQELIQKEEEEEEEEEAPRRLNTKTCGQFLEITTNKLCARYWGEGRNTNDVGAIQADRPVPSHARQYYFEISVKNQGLKGRISIGFADEHFNKNRHPGWEINSYGYHGDDGGFFLHGNHFDLGGATFTKGDTVALALVILRTRFSSPRMDR